VIGARLCRLEGEAGAIVAGASADLPAVDGDPLEDISLLQGDGAHIPVIVARRTFAKNTPG
jgi:imidazolonepropionase-like amidohydrolase